jgi:hypothetical protein
VIASRKWAQDKDNQGRLGRNAPAPSCALKPGKYSMDCQISAKDEIPEMRSSLWRTETRNHPDSMPRRSCDRVFCRGYFLAGEERKSADREYRQRLSAARTWRHLGARRRSVCAPGTGCPASDLRWISLASDILSLLGHTPGPGPGICPGVDPPPSVGAESHLP